MKKILSIELPQDKAQSYSIYLSDDSFSKLKKDIEDVIQDRKALFIISKKVFKLYRDLLDLSFNNVLVINDGEKEKNYKNYLKIIQKAIELGMTRKDLFISIGGGVIGDLAGYAASTYMRGIDYIQIPTTLLSMVDSSVGGKTAIDLCNAKNIIGTFYQPKNVFININFLKTLDKRQFKSGLGEILKYAFIEKSCNCTEDLFFFEYLTLCYEKLYSRDPHSLIRVIEQSINLKKIVVEQDEKEAGMRKILNFGHTFAHALETKTKYRKYTHGEAVIYGMFLAFDWAYKNNMINYSYYRLATELLEKYDFSKLNMNKLSKKDKLELMELMKIDKNALKNKVSFILPVDKKIVKEYIYDYATLIDIINT